MPTILTKSKYLLGLECPKHLWLTFNEPGKIREKTKAEKFKFDEGQRVGELVRKLFPDGINLPIDDYSKNIRLTKEALNKKKPLFEAGFAYKNCFSRADILIPSGDEWDIIEVKSGTKVKKINLHDVSFQKYVYEANGIKIRNCYLMHINNEYVRKGDIDLKTFFTKQDITSEVNEIKNVAERITSFLETLSKRNPPKAGLFIEQLFSDGYHDCFLEECVQLPDNNVFCLYRGGKLSYKLFEMGIENIKSIPPDIKLNEKQKIQKECEISCEEYVNKSKIKKFLSKLEYPLHYLDFETFSTAIPLFDGLKPYAQVPFQFSLHIIEKVNKAPQQYAYLYRGSGDPRKEFILELRKVLGIKGSVVVFNQSFEISRLKEFAEYLPEYKEWVDAVLSRIIDLLLPFREFDYYNSKQQGSASIKKVLPALVRKDYYGMEIGDGGTASVEFFNAAYGNYSEKEREKVYENLSKYCEMDTLAEVMIVEKLREISGK